MVNQKKQKWSLLQPASNKATLNPMKRRVRQVGEGQSRRWQETFHAFQCNQQREKIWLAVLKV